MATRACNSGEMYSVAAQYAERAVIENSSSVTGVKECWKHRLSTLRQELGYNEAPALEKYEPREWRPGPEADRDEDLVRAAGDLGTTIFHPVGTCRMGRDALSVVDDRLRVRGIEQRSNTVQNNEQLDQLFSMISRSQQGYRDLIDTFEDLLFSVGNDGRILTVNRSFAVLINRTFAQVVGRRLDEFFELLDPRDRDAMERWLPSFHQRRRWTGLVRARVRQTGEVRYFDCVLHAIVRDDAVHGISGFARDVTKERENETRFTELFQTLREGVYLASADDRITEVNPALAQILGLENKEGLLNREIASLYAKSEDRADERGRLDDVRAAGLGDARDILGPAEEVADAGEEIPFAETPSIYLANLLTKIADCEAREKQSR